MLILRNINFVALTSIRNGHVSYYFLFENLNDPKYLGIPVNVKGQLLFLYQDVPSTKCIQSAVT